MIILETCSAHIQLQTVLGAVQSFVCLSVVPQLKPGKGRFDVLGVH